MSYNEVPDEDDYDYNIKAAREREKIYLVATFCFLLVLGCFIALSLTGCTISFQNISTHGTATDLVDEEQAPTSEIDPDVSIPAIGM